MFAVALYLVLERGKRIPRQAIVELVWPEVKSEQRARQRLRQTLLRLREMGLPITNQGDSVVLDKSGVQADFESLTGVDPAPLMNGSRSSLEFLPDYSPRLSERFLDWVEQQRSRVHAGVQRLFVARIQQSRIRGDWREVDALAEECLRLDPYNEEAVMARAESAVMRGSKREALAILDGYMDALGPKVEAIGLPAKILRSRIAERLTEPRYAMLSEKHFVGRESSMELLSGLFRDARKGMGSGAFIWGPPGIGKSRLVQEIVNAGALQGARVVSTKCQPSDVGRPLSAFADLVPPLRTLPGALGCSTQTVSLLQRLTERDKTEVRSPVEPGDAEFLAATIRRAIFDLVDAVVDEGPLILVVEDVHWLDATSWSILRAMVEWSTTKKLLILMTSRTPHATQEKAPDPDRGMHRHPLQPLADADADSLLQLLVETRENALPESVRSWSVAAAEGNPYFLRELVTHWVETRQSFGVPRSLAALIDARLDRLSSLALRVLQFCAVLAKHSTFERLEQITGYANHSLLDAIEELSGASLLVTEKSEIRPKHDLLATAAMARLGDAARKLVHRQVATVLEAEIGEKHAPALMWDCAEHWVKAGLDEHALAVARDCATYLIRVGAAPEAVYLFERALDMCTTDADRLETVIGLCRALRWCGRWDRLGTVTSDAISIASIADLGDITDELEFLHLESEFRRGLQCQSTFASMVQFAYDGEKPPILRLEATLLALTDAHSEEGGSATAILIYSIAQQLQKEIAAPRLAAQIGMIFETDFGDLDVAVRHAEDLLRLEEEADDPISLARARSNVAVCFRRAGLIDRAKQLLTENHTVAERRAIFATAARAAYLLAVMAISEEDYDSAARWAEQVYVSAEKSEESILRHVSTELRVRLALHRRDFQSARDAIRTFDPHLRTASARFQQQFAAMNARLHILEGRPVAEDDFATLAKTVSTLTSSGMQDFAVHTLALAHLARHQTEEAKELLALYLGRHRRERFPPPPSLASLSAELSSQDGAAYLTQRELSDSA